MKAHESDWPQQSPGLRPTATAHCAFYFTEISRIKVVQLTAQHYGIFIATEHAEHHKTPTELQNEQSGKMLALKSMQRIPEPERVFGPCQCGQKRSGYHIQKLNIYLAQYTFATATNLS